MILPGLMTAVFA